jgi:chromosome segregation ATPase
MPAPVLGATSGDLDYHSGSMVPGRVYVLGQVLAREHERSVALQEQLEQRLQEVERLRGEVVQLRQHEGALQARLDEVVASRGTVAAAPARGPAAASAASTQRAHREAEAQSAGAIAGLRAALADEQQRREQVETELARLKEETSAPPYEHSGATAADLAAAKQEVAQLRTALEDERAARERLAQDFRALQERAVTERTAAEAASGDAPQVRTRLQELEEEKQNITQSFNRSLTESQERATELERQLALARSTSDPSAGDGGAASVRAENTALRSRLDEEHRRTEELGAKLKVAMRVTDLIFKMQAQQALPQR